MGNKRLTAKEAKQLTLSSEHIFNFVYKEIESAAKRNECETPISFYAIDPTIIEKVLTDLNNNGYLVEVIPDTDSMAYTVSW